jgi:hypothetical protein
MQMIPRFPKKPVGPATQPSVVSFMHDPETKSLTVNFHGGRSYRYDKVHPDHAAALAKAASKGAYLNEHIIPHHTFTKIKGDRTSTSGAVG